MRTTAKLATVGAVSSALLGACAAPNNQRPTIGAGFDAPDEPAVVLPAVDGRAPGVALTDDGPSLAGLDRSNWARTTILIPNDHTQHHPHFASLRSWNGEDYTGAAHPTLATAIDVDPRTDGDLYEWIVWPLKPVRDGIFGVRHLAGSDRFVTHSPRSDAYQRSRPATGAAAGSAGGE